jgi:type IV secretion system protein VirB11
MPVHTVVKSIDQQTRLEAKLRRELGDLVLRALSDERTEDIVLNPDSRLWVKRQCEGFECVGGMAPAQAQSAMGTIAAQKCHPRFETTAVPPGM